MLLQACEIEKYMAIHEISKVPVEVIDLNIPSDQSLGQGARKLAKRLIITKAENKRLKSKIDSNDLIDAVHISYAIYNSFRRSKCYVPNDFSFNIIAGVEGEKILHEFNNDNDLAHKFIEIYNNQHHNIQEKLDLAAQLLNEAMELAEEHGIPFSSNMTFHEDFKNSYIPNSFPELYGALNSNEDNLDKIYNSLNINDDIDLYAACDGETGWTSFP